jgi:hypothetical protein
MRSRRPCLFDLDDAKNSRDIPHRVYGRRNRRRLGPETPPKLGRLYLGGETDEKADHLRVGTGPTSLGRLAEVAGYPMLYSLHDTYI